MNKRMSRCTMGLLWVLSLAALVACGGGGGDDSPRGVEIPQGARSGAASENARVTEANARTLAAPLARAVMSAGSSEVPGVSSERASPQARATASAQRWTLWALAQAAPRAADRARALAVSTTVLACPFGGSLTLTLDDDDDNRKLSRGDRISIVTVDCRSELGQPRSSGSLQLAINAVELDGNDDPTALDVTITFGGFEEDGFGTTNGTVRLWFKEDASGGETLRLSYSATAVTAQGSDVRYSFDITGGSSASGAGTADFNGSFTVDNDTFLMSSTTFSFAAGSNEPASGSVTLTDFIGNKLTLRANGNGTFDIIIDLLGLPRITLPGVLWRDQLLP
jgi:hypothetical protein